MMTDTKKPSSESQTQESPEATKQEFKRKRYIDRQRENRKKAGQGNIYYYRALKESIPLVFRGYDQDFVGTISKDGGIRFTLKLASGRKVLDKIELQYTCKAHSYEKVNQAVQIDENVKRLELKPIIEIEERYKIPDKDLKRCQEERHKLRLTMRGGEILEGMVEWWGGYDIKLELATKRSVVVFRHAVYQHEVLF